MRSCTIVLSLAWFAFLLLASGCERRKATENPPEAYDPSVEPPASAVMVKENPDLLADQAGISREYKERLREAVAAAEPESEAAETEAIAQVKQLLADTIEQAADGNSEAMFALLADQDAEALQTMMSDSSQVQEKIQQVQELIAEKLNIEVPESISGNLEGWEASTLAWKKATGYDSAVSLLQATSIEGVEFEQVADEVLATSPDGAQLTFVPMDSEYIVSLSPETAAFIQAMATATAAQNDFLDKLIEGIDSGTIIAVNFEQEATSIAEDTLTTAMVNMAELIASAAEQEPSPEEGLTPDDSAEPSVEDATEEPEDEDSEEEAEPAGDSEGGGMGGTLRRITRPTEGAEDF